MKLDEIAKRINAHLKRFESDPKINTKTTGNLRRYFVAGAVASGTRIFVTYITYQGHSSLSKADALAYLAWLDAGNVGRHYDAVRLTQVKPSEDVKNAANKR